jgi:hypothetical protein
MKVQARLAIKATLQMVFAFVSSRASSIDRQRTQGGLIAALLFLLAGCSSGPTTIPFLNNSHRQIYSLNEEDLKKVQFYVSTDVVAQVHDTTATQSFMVPKLTPGVVTAAGPNWLKVSFREGGADVPFVADPQQKDGRYWIASEVEGSKDFKKVIDLPGRVFIYKGVRLTLASGSDAILLVDWEGWKELVETRKVTEGRRVGDK